MDFWSLADADFDEAGVEEDDDDTVDDDEIEESDEAGNVEGVTEDELEEDEDEDEDDEEDEDVELVVVVEALPMGVTGRGEGGRTATGL